MALAISLPRESLARCSRIQASALATSGALSSCRTALRLSGLCPLIARSISNRASIRRTASSASGEITAGFLPCALRLSTSDFSPDHRALPRFPDDGRICLSNNAAERAVRWLFCGSDRDGERAAVMVMNDIDPQAWLADVLSRIAERPVHRLDDLLPWNWNSPSAQASQAA